MLVPPHLVVRSACQQCVRDKEDSDLPASDKVTVSPFTDVDVVALAAFATLGSGEILHDSPDVAVVATRTSTRCMSAILAERRVED